MQRLAARSAMVCSRRRLRTPAFVRYSKRNMEESAAQAGQRCFQADPRLRDRRQHRSRFENRKRRPHASRPPCILLTKCSNIKGSADVLLESAGITFEELQPVADAMERAAAKPRRKQ